MKNLFSFVNKLEDIENIIKKLELFHYNTENSSIACLAKNLNFTDYLSLIYKINYLKIEKKELNKINVEIFFICENNSLVFYGPCSSYFENINFCPLSDVFSTLNISENKFDFFTTQLYNNSFLFVFPFNEKNEKELIELFEENNSHSLFLF